MDISRPDGLVLEHLVLSLTLRAIRDVARAARMGWTIEQSSEGMAAALYDILELCGQPIGRPYEDAKADIKKIVDRWGDGSGSDTKGWIAELTARRGQD